MVAGQVDPEPLNAWQRRLHRRLLRLAGKRRTEALAPADWEAYFRLHAHVTLRIGKAVFRSLPTDPRCRICGAPFAGTGSRIVAPLGYRPSRKNASLCATCVELSPPGGTTTDVGVVFADVRGYTSISQTTSPADLGRMLAGFYEAAEHVLFRQAIVDKLIGDAVMALYIPLLGGLDDPGAVMLRHACELLGIVGEAGAESPLAVGVGMDFGKAFVGNIGNRALYDFTAVGHVVNVAARLQGQAGPGEILLSEAVARMLPNPPGERVELELKGVDGLVGAYRVIP